MTASEVQKNLDNHMQMIDDLEDALKILKQIDEIPKQDTLDHELTLKRLLFMFQWAQSIQKLRTRGENLPSEPEKTLFIKLCEFSHLDKMLFTPTSAVPGICTLLHASMIISVWIGLAALLVRMIAFLSVQITECKQQDKGFIKQQINLLIECLNKEGIQMPTDFPSNITANTGAVYLATKVALNELKNNNDNETIKKLETENDELKQQLQCLMKQNSELCTLLANLTINNLPSTDSSNTNQPPVSPEPNQTA